MKYILYGLLFLFLWCGGLYPSATQANPTGKEKITLLEAIEKISKQYDVYFTFDMTLVSEVEVEYEQSLYSSAEDALGRILKGTGLKYKFFDHRFVIIYKDDAKGLESLKQMSKHLSGLIREGENKLEPAGKRGILNIPKLPDQSILKTVVPVAFSVEGTIINNEGETLVGVTVQVKGTNKATTTDANGRFSLNDIEANAVLVISYVGFETQEVRVGGQANLKITMLSADQALEQVVVVGYGTQKKSDLTGSVGHINDKSIAERSAFNIEQSLAGKIAGVNVQTNSGRPGGRTSISIRGYSSINASNDPLYVIDGIIWTAGINDLNPNEIKSIDILKDASATAIYGTRGSNGVILITTKRGETGSNVSFENYIKINWLPRDRKLDVLNSKEFMFIEEEQYKNAPKFDSVGFAGGKYEDPIEKRKKYLVGNMLGNKELFTLDNNGIPQPIYDVDWQDMVTRTALAHVHNLSYTGRSAHTNYGLFLGYINEDGIVKESFAKRYNTRVVIDHQIMQWLKVGGNISYSRTTDSRVDESVGSNNALRLLVEMVSFIPYKYDDGTYGYRLDYSGLEEGDNPLAQLQELKTIYNSNSFNGNTYANFKIIEGLEFTSTFGITNLNRVNQRFKSGLSLMSPKGMNDAQISSSESLFWQWSNRLNFTASIKNKHSFNFLIGSEFQKLNYLTWSARTQKMPDDYYLWNNLSAGATPLAPSSSANGYQMESYFGRINYSFMKRYLLTLTGRYDGSSRFGVANKYAFFPSTALAWRISEEDFLKDGRLISNLKLRASFGAAGNSEIGSYRSQANLSSNSYIFNGSRVTGSSIDRLAYLELQWEKALQYNVGFDLGLFSNKISLEADFYIKNTSNLLFDAPVPSSSGYAVVTQNIGSMKNRGIEVSLNTQNVRTKLFDWSTVFNLSLLENKITALGKNNEDIIYGIRDILILRVGETVGSFYGYLRDGIWSTSQAEEAKRFGKKPGDLRMKDLNKDGVINSDDRIILGKGIPDFYGTFLNTFRLKNFDLVLDLQYSYGNDLYMNSRSTGEARQGQANSYSTVLEAWTPENQNATLEQVRPPSAGYSYYSDDRRVENGSFIRGRNLLFGYNVPVSTNSGIKFKSLRLYAAMQNFFLITKYPGYDPEVSTYDDTDQFAQGVLFYDYPKSRMFLIGVNINF
ncbi:MAG TPA: TonB-dependent receptor [Niabella sp.]|nr:TonB-dependent receptor [Niabella sp.]